MNIILFAIPGFVFLILAEWIYGLAKGRNTYRIVISILSLIYLTYPKVQTTVS